MFVDEIKVFGKAGAGGKGCVAFLRETFRPKGGPSGGNGGRGGSVILQADHDLNNLIAQYFVPRLIAENGHPGMGKGMDGPAGKDLLVRVPCGTLVWRLDPDPMTEVEGADEADPVRPALASGSRGRPLIRRAGPERALEVTLDEPAPPSNLGGPAGRTLAADLTTHGQQFVLCKGGRGGLGNRNFATATRQTPRFAQPGEPGDHGDFVLELRLLAEVGLVGYPNAGKSTLLTAISRARPKIAPYPFTTLHPQIGIVEYADYRRLTVCDVPGLIEGAHKDVGLGHAFLRHIQRCQVIVLLIDMAATDGRNPWDDHANLLRELELYNPVLLTRPRLVVANKMDEPQAEANLKKFKRRVPRTPVLRISAAFDDGVELFKSTVREIVEQSGG